MLTSKKADIYSGLASIAIGVIFYLQTSDLNEASKVFPMVLIGFLVVTGLILLVRGIISKESKTFSNNIDYKRAFSIVATAIVYFVAIIYIGFYVSSFVFLLLMSFLLSDKGRNLASLGTSIIFAVVLTVAVYVTFTLSLKVPTPAGILF